MNKCPFIAMDLETTGLDIYNDQILQVGLVAFDKEGIKNKEVYYVKHDRIYGQPYALAMNQKILYKISKGEDCHTWDCVDDFIYLFVDNNCAKKPIPVGFNVGPFDLAFLNHWASPNNKDRFHHRCIELGTVFAHTETGLPMTSTEALKKYLNKEVSHDALEDAEDAAKLYIGRLNGKW